MKIIIAIFALLLLLSCTEENVLIDNNTPQITALSRNNSFLYDTISVFGKGLKGSDTKILINGTESGIMPIYSTETELKFVANSTLDNVQLSLKVDGTESNNKSLSVKLTPSFDTVFVEFNSFMMGALSGFSDETPIHSVNLTRDLIVFTHEVTNQLWHQVMDTVVVPESLFDFPKYSITWIRAITFCNKLSEVYGLDNAYKIDGANVTFDYNANGWRLPTEAEWEYLCRAGSEDDFSGNGDINQMGYFDSNSGLQKHRIGEKLANQFGLYDVHGNLWEWCWDKYSEDYYNVTPKDNPTGPVGGARHVMRGGSYQDGFNFARISNRTINKIDYNAIGIRLVRNAN